MIIISQNYDICKFDKYNKSIESLNLSDKDFDGWSSKTDDFFGGGHPI